MADKLFMPPNEIKYPVWPSERPTIFGTSHFGDAGGCEREKNSARPIDNTFHVYDNQITAELRESDRILLFGPFVGYYGRILAGKNDQIAFTFVYV